MANQSDIKKLTKMIAKEFGLNMAQIEDVIDSVFSFQAHVMKTKCDRKTMYFPSVRIPYWGVFHCPPYSKDYYKKFNERRKDNNKAT